MSTCPYTYLKSFFGSKKSTDGIANNLFVKVIKSGVEVVSVSLPAKSAYWLIELIPTDVVAKIKKEEIPLEKIQADLQKQKVLSPQSIFILREEHRTVEIWLE